MSQGVEHGSSLISVPQGPQGLCLFGEHSLENKEAKKDKLCRIYLCFCGFPLLWFWYRCSPVRRQEQSWSSSLTKKRALRPRVSVKIQSFE